MKILDIINTGSKELKLNNINSYRLDSEILMSKVLSKRREEVLINLDQELNNKQILEFNQLIRRRALKEPIAYILEQKEFWSKDFKVNRHTLIPRPETELMIEKLIQIFKNKSISILDVGTGSGCILISLVSELKNTSGVGIDVSKKALQIAKKNAFLNKINNKVKFLKCSFEQSNFKKFDLIVSNPPYIERGKIKRLNDDIKKHEPWVALDGGNDGLDVIAKVIYKAKYTLKINGTLALEIGNGQFKKVSKLLRNNNFRLINNIKDYKDNTRCIISKLI